MQTAGKIILAIAILIGTYALLVFDPSVEAAGQRVANIHKLSFQSNLLLVAGVGAIIGTILLVFGRRSSVEGASASIGTTIPDRDAAQVRCDSRFSDAIKSSDLATMRRMLSNKEISAHGRNLHGRGWLQYATSLNALEPCKILLEHGARPTDLDELGKSALVEAKSNPELEKLFLASAQ